MNRINWINLILFVLISQLAGIAGAFFTIDSIPTWYQTLNRPIFAPANWVFGPVWTILYTLIGIAGYKIYKSKNKKLLKIFWLQLFLNAIWTPIFFGAKNLNLAFIEIIFLWISIAYLVKNSQKIKHVSYLLLPYLLWVSFALMLNLGFALLN